MKTAIITLLLIAAIAASHAQLTEVECTFEGMNRSLRPRIRCMRDIKANETVQIGYDQEALVMSMHTALTDNVGTTLNTLADALEMIDARFKVVMPALALLVILAMASIISTTVQTVFNLAKAAMWLGTMARESYLKETKKKKGE